MSCRLPCTSPAYLLFLPLQPCLVLLFLGLFIPILREIREMMYQYNHDYRFSSAKYERVFGDVVPMEYSEGVKQTAAFYGARS